MKTNYFYRKPIKRLLFILPIFVLICFAFCISSYAQSVGQEEMMKSIQIINPHPPFSLRLWLDKEGRATYAPGERIKISFQASQDSFVTLYNYDSEGGVIIIFPNQYSPNAFVKAGHTYSVEGLINPSTRAGIEYVQGFATSRPILITDREQNLISKEFMPKVSKDYKSHTNTIKGILVSQPPATWVSSNLLSYTVPEETVQEELKVEPTEKPEDYNVKKLQKNKESEEEKYSNIILDLERVSTSDVLYLRNGDVITGTILNKNYNVTTSYTELQINNRMIREIYLESGVNNISKIITINNNRISGYIDNPIIVFKLKNGNEIEVRREKILKLFFEVNKQDLEAISQNQFIILKNGDYFSGTILEEEIYLTTTYAEIHLSLNDIKSITQIRGENPLTKIEMLNGDLIQGILKTEDIEVILDVGPRIKIYQDQIDIIYCQKGFIPYKELEFLNKNLIFDKSGSNKNRYVKTSMGLEILELANDSPLLDLGIETGDIIINIDGKQIDSLQMLDLVFKELLLGNRGKAIMEVIRGKENLFFNLIDLIK